MIIKMIAIPGGKLGTVGKIEVKTGDKVSVGDVLVQVETAKGNRPIKSTVNGTISKIICDEGASIASYADMFEIEEGVLTTKDSDNNNCCYSVEENQDTTLENAQDLSKVKTSEEITTDLLVIGGGPGGYVAAIYAAKNGLKVCLVEKSELGGTCLNVGCIPTKALVKSSEICHSVHNARNFGVLIDGSVSVDMKRVIEYKDEVKNRLVTGIDCLMKKNGIDVIAGQASFLDSNTVAVNGTKTYTIKAKDIIIATGSKISKIAIPGIDLPFVLNSTTALSSTKLPKSIAIIGGGVIGMEFAFIYKHFGVEVYVIECMDRLLTMVDKDISKEIMNIAQEENIHVHVNAKVKKIQDSINGDAIVTYEEKDKEHLLVVEKVLVAIGREPNLDGLAIENSHVELNERGRGIKVDSSMRTNIEHVYAIGDVTNIIQLAHVASHQGMVAVDNILDKEKKMDYTCVPNVVFTSPEIASVGINEDEAKAKGLDIKVSKFCFAGNGKALTMNEPRGFIKLVKNNESGKIIGGSIIGADASSLISVLTVAISNGLSEKEITETIFAHPTTSEVIHEAALELGIGALHQ